MRYALAIAALLAALSAPALADQESARAAVNDEAKVLGAAWREDTLVVFMADDGSRRDGYAEYICQLLIDHEANAPKGRGALVRIVNVKRKDDTLGSATCPTISPAETKALDAMFEVDEVRGGGWAAGTLVVEIDALDARPAETARRVCETLARQGIEPRGREPFRIRVIEALKRPERELGAADCPES